MRDPKYARKTVSFGPFNWTVSRSGVSTSVGGRRGRVNVNSRGRVRRSVNFGKGFRWMR